MAVDRDASPTVTGDLRLGPNRRVLQQQTAFKFSEDGTNRRVTLLKERELSEFRYFEVI